MPYPVRVRGRLDEPLSRWLWLVKWLLAIPHYFVLAFLWIAFFGVSVLAFFAILFTGRYPRALFDFNVGVLRWTWRVVFYTYAALGTDRYPPFTLASVPDYPATVDIEYPERLSRGLVLVKWWLLAIPHYIVVGLLIGTISWTLGDSNWRLFWSGGLIGLFCLIAGVVLLFRGRYPRALFDLVVGLDRWVLRVAAYAGLMTDRYPPFRLDQGPDEPGAPEPWAKAAPSPGPGAEATALGTATAAAAPVTASRWTTGRVVLVILGSIAALVGAGLLAAGIAFVVVDQTQRDDEGYLMSPSERFSSNGYAVVSESAEVAVEGEEWAVRSFLGTVKVQSVSARPVFVGIGLEADVELYLGDVRRSVVTEISGDPEYDEELGGAPAGSPADQPFWAASIVGAGTRELTWDPEDGDWVAVLMNEDGSRGVQAELSIGAELDSFLWVGIGTAIAGAVILVLGALGIALGASRAARG